MTNPYNYNVNPYTTNPQTQYESLKEPQKPPLDPYSIAGLASSLFCPPAGLVLSIIGYNNTKDNLKRYKTIAIIGLVFSILGTIQLAFDFEFTTATLITWIIAAIFIAISFIAVNSVNEKSKHTTPSQPTIPLTGNPEIDRWNQVAQSIPGYSPEYAERIDPVKQPLHLDLPTKYIRVQQFMDRHVPADQRANPYINPPSRDLATSVYGLERYAQGSTYKSHEWFEQHLPYWSVPDDYRTGGAIQGRPGQGLNDATDEFGEQRVKIGQEGEMNLMKMMVASGLLDSSTNIMSFWSLRLPDCDLDIDVDCAVMYADRLWLIDAKRYETQEGMLYASDGGDTLINVHQGTNISGAKDHTLSTSMAIAYERYKVAMPELEVIPVIALVPGKAGVAAVAPCTSVHVNNLKTNGGIWVVQANDLIDVMKQEKASIPPTSPKYSSISAFTIVDSMIKH